MIETTYVLFALINFFHIPNNKIHKKITKIDMLYRRSVTVLTEQIDISKKLWLIVMVIPFYCAPISTVVI